jgi:hypothetical protein
MMISHKIQRTFTKHHPVYFNDLARYPATNPILIAPDWRGVNFIRCRKGICLLCNKSPEYYDFSFCYQREIWVIYSCQPYFFNAMQLARTIQLSGASKILILLISAEWLEVTHVNN